MILPDFRFGINTDDLYDAANWLCADRSDWLPYVQYFALAKGSFGAANGLWSLISSARGYTIKETKTIKEQTIEGELEFATGGLLLLSSLNVIPLSLYTAFVINASVDALTAWIHYARLCLATPSQYAYRLDNIRVRSQNSVTSGGERAKYFEERRNARNNAIAATITIACWALTEAIDPAAILYITLAITYLLPLYQLAKPILGAVASTLFACCVRKDPDSEEGDRVLASEYHRTMTEGPGEGDEGDNQENNSPGPGSSSSSPGYGTG